jgi:hypothetical protein
MADAGDLKSLVRKSVRVRVPPRAQMKFLRRSKLKPSLPIQVNIYKIMARAVEEGIRYGWNRAHKHTDSPTKEHTIDEIEKAVMNELSEIFIFNGEDYR